LKVFGQLPFETIDDYYQATFWGDSKLRTDAGKGIKGA
jgi:hypothetical protein